MSTIFPKIYLKFGLKCFHFIAFEVIYIIVLSPNK